MKLKILNKRQLVSLAEASGLSILGFSPKIDLSEESKKLKEWQQKGFNGEMAYMNRPAENFTNLENLLPGAKSLVCFAIHYSYQAREERKEEHGLVARYAWGKDYHLVLKERLDSFVKKVEKELGRNIEYRNFTDSIPLLERAFAERSGLGFIGKNTMLIQKGHGSYFLLGEVLWDLVIEDQSKLNLLDYKSECGTCSRCIDDCPTGAILEPRVLDARKCISYITIEKRRKLSIWEREAVGEWIFGCDKCQDRCPFNHKSLNLEHAPLLDEFKEEVGVGQQISIRDLLQIRTNREFEARFKDTPLLRPRRAGLLRNGLCVAVNTKSESLLDLIINCFEEDSSEVVRSHALWAAYRLNKVSNGKNQRLDRIFNKAINDQSQAVRAEADELLDYNI